MKLVQVKECKMLSQNKKNKKLICLLLWLVFFTAFNILSKNTQSHVGSLSFILMRWNTLLKTSNSTRLPLDNIGLDTSLIS